MAPQAVGCVAQLGGVPKPLYLSLCDASAAPVALCYPVLPIYLTIKQHLQVVGITNGYHGDTLGVMDAVAPSPYVGPEQMPW